MVVQNTKMNLFDELKTRIEFLKNNPDRDNEATRHDLLIYPLITNESGLGWSPIDIISQSTIDVPENISESHIFRGAIPKIRKPDLIICPKDIIKNIAVIEEKKRQTDFSEIISHRLQLSEYQSLYECNWGILTDGEKWLIKKGFETQFEFKTINELQNNIKEFRNALGRDATIERYRTYNTFDLIFILPVNSTEITIFPEYSDIPVIVVGVKGNTLTENGLGYSEYKNLKYALIDFPDLHPELNTERFTWAMKEVDSGKITKLRFETWKADEFYST